MCLFCFSAHCDCRRCCRCTGGKKGKRRVKGVGNIVPETGFYFLNHNSKLSVHFLVAFIFFNLPYFIIKWEN